MSAFSPHAGRWIARLQETSLQVRVEPDRRARDARIGETWELIRTALTRFLRAHEHRCGGLSREERQDLAAEKALDLVQRIERGEWDMSGHTSGEIHAYLSRTARNLIVDFGRSQKRSAAFVRANEATVPAHDGPVIDLRGGRGRDPAPTPEARHESRDYVRHLRECVERLKPRARLAWFLRAFYGLASRDIGTHPGVAARPGTVDLMVHRGRAALAECMRRKGLDPREMPPGTFIALWEYFHALRLQGEARAHES